MALSEDIAKWIRVEVKKGDKKGIVLGLSGGLDSAVVGAISKIAMGDRVLALILPCETASGDIECAEKIARKFDIKTKKIVLDEIFNKFVEINPQAPTLAKGNLKPRLRMTVLYYFANDLNYLVAGTGNKSELVLGYFTKYGDGGVDILPLGGILKTEIIELARKLRVPDEVIKRPPSAGLWEGQTDEGEMGITYEELDKIITAIEKGDVAGVDRKNLTKVKKMIEGSEHKRAKVPVFGINTKS